MTYTAAYYNAQARVMTDVRTAHATGLCPVCRQRPSATWPDGTLRITCGDSECFRHWLPVPALKKGRS